MHAFVLFLTWQVHLCRRCWCGSPEQLHFPQTLSSPGSLWLLVCIYPPHRRRRTPRPQPSCLPARADFTLVMYCKLHQGGGGNQREETCKTCTFIPFNKKCVLRLGLAMIPGTKTWAPLRTALPHWAPTTTSELSCITSLRTREKRRRHTSVSPRGHLQTVAVQTVCAFPFLQLCMLDIHNNLPCMGDYLKLETR